MEDPVAFQDTPVQESLSDVVAKGSIFFVLSLLLASQFKLQVSDRK